MHMCLSAYDNIFGQSIRLECNRLFLYLSVFSFFTVLYQIMTNYLRGRDKIREVATAGIISAVAIIVSNILLLLVLKLV